MIAMTFVLITSLGAAQPDVRPQPQHADTVYLGLSQAIAAAMMHNLELLASLEGVQTVRAQVARAHGTFDPEVGIEPGYSFAEQMHYTADGRNRISMPSRRYAGSLAGLLVAGTEYRVSSSLQSSALGQELPGNTHELSLTLTQPLMRGLGFATAPIRAAERASAAGEGRYLQQRNEAVSRVTQQYLLLVLRERQEAAAVRSLRRAEELEGAYTELRTLARVTEVDLLTARFAVADRRATALTAQRERSDAQDELLFAVYGADAPSIVANDDIVYRAADTALALPALPPLPQAIAMALAARPDVHGAAQEVEQARLNERVARNALLPTLNLAGTLSAAGISQSGWSLAPRQAESGNRLDWGMGLSMSYPLRASRARGDNEEAHALFRQSELLLENTRNAVRLEVRAAYRAIVSETQRLSVQRDATRLARAQYEGERERLRLGVTDLFRVLQFEDAAADAELAELAAAFDLSAAVARFAAAMGEGR